MLKNLYFHWKRWRFNWQQYQATLLQFQRKHELEDLADWAKRKRLGVYHHYKKLILETEEYLATKNIRYPHVFKYARLAYQVNQLISPQPQYYTGYAAQYRRFHEIE